MRAFPRRRLAMQESAADLFLAGAGHLPDLCRTVALQVCRAGAHLINSADWRRQLVDSVAWLPHGQAVSSPISPCCICCLGKVLQQGGEVTPHLSARSQAIFLFFLLLHLSMFCKVCQRGGGKRAEEDGAGGQECSCGYGLLRKHA